MFGSSSRAWQEADRVDRLRYARPARVAVDQASAGEGDGLKGCAPSCSEDDAQTLYSVLNVGRTASLSEIKRAYRRLLVTAHPDKGGSAEQFQRLKAAFARLSDPAQRLIYDEWLGVDQCSGAGSTGADQQAQASGQSTRRSQGVTVVVHGQTQGSPREEPQACSACPAAACPAQCSSNAQLQQATANLQQLTAAGGAAACLAEAYVLRAQLRCAADQPHHALFDAEEALRLDPGNQEAALLVRSLHEGMQDAERLHAADEASEEEDEMGWL